MIIQTPAHPLPQLATYELGNYRNDLEHAIERTPEGNAERILLRKQLDDVLAEQRERLEARSKPLEDTS